MVLKKRLCWDWATPATASKQVLWIIYQNRSGHIWGHPGPVGQNTWAWLRTAAHSSRLLMWMTFQKPPRAPEFIPRLVRRQETRPGISEWWQFSLCHHRTGSLQFQLRARIPRQWKGTAQMNSEAASALTFHAAEVPTHKAAFQS